MSGSTTQTVRSAIQKRTEAVFARAYLSSNQSSLGASSWDKINLNSVDIDLGNNFDTTNKKFVAPVTGLYKIIASIEFTSVTTAKKYKTAIYKNGSSLREVTGHAGLADNLTVSCTDEFYLQKDDYIELYGFPDASGVAAVSGDKATILVVRLVTKEGIRQ